MRFHVRQFLVVASVAAVLGATMIGSAEASQPTGSRTGKTVTACVSDTGTMRVSPRGKSITCRATETALRIKVASGKHQKGPAGPGAVVCVDETGRPRLDLAGGCAEGSTPVRMTFLSSHGASVQLTCINSKGLIGVPGNTGACAPNTVAVPVTTTGALALPDELRRPWQPVSHAPLASAGSTTSTQPSEGADSTEAPAPSSTPTPTSTPAPAPTNGGGGGGDSTPTTSPSPTPEHPRAPRVLPPMDRPARGTLPVNACASAPNNDYTGLTRSNCVFTGSLVGANFSGATLTNVLFDSADLTSADLTDANFANDRILNSNLSGVNGTRVNFTNVDFAGSSLSGTFDGADFTWADFSSAASLSGTMSPLVSSDYIQLPSNPWGYSLSNPDCHYGCTGARTWWASWDGTSILGPSMTVDDQDLRDEDFTNRNLSEAHLTNDTMDGADFTNTFVVYTMFTGSSLRGADLHASYGDNRYGDSGTSPIILAGDPNSIGQEPTTDFTGAHFEGINFHRSRMGDAILNEAYLNGAIINSSEVQMQAQNIHVSSATSITMETPETATVQLPNGEYLLIGRGMTLKDIDLQGVDLGLFSNSLQFSMAVWEDVDASGVHFTYYNTPGVPASGVAGGIYFSGGRFTNVDFTGADMRYVAMDPSTSFTNVTFAPANLSYASLEFMNLSGANLTNTQMIQVDICDANLSGANLTGANLSPDPVWSSSCVARVNLTNANLTNANLTNALLFNSNLTGANMTGANMTGVNHTNVTLSATTRCQDGNLATSSLSGYTCTWS